MDKYRDEGTILNITGNAGTHYNSVRIVETYDDFIVVEPAAGAEQAGGTFRGACANVNTATITRLEEAGPDQRLRARLKGS
ncbi:MAG: hypothetical protein A2Y63_02885 [Candidatus Riflebacteria bacterium RBG_13_59_9]|nr:MAG: hypothetical protein A2Y63_02885 [Candidatus Riflebacteria bacterium RBG_13_59_9]